MIDRGRAFPSAGEAKMLGLARSTFYYKPRPVSAEDLKLMRRLDELHLDAIPLGEGSQELLTMLYRSTHRLSRAGVSVENLAHSASFQIAGQDSIKSRRSNI